MTKIKKGYWVEAEIHQKIIDIAKLENRKIGDFLAELIEGYACGDELEIKLSKLESDLKKQMKTIRVIEDHVDVLIKMLNSEYLVTENVAGYFKDESALLREAKAARQQERDAEILKQLRKR